MHRLHAAVHGGLHIGGGIVNEQGSLRIQAIPVEQAAVDALIRLDETLPGGNHHAVEKRENLRVLLKGFLKGIAGVIGEHIAALAVLLAGIQRVHALVDDAEAAVPALLDALDQRAQRGAAGAHEHEGLLRRDGSAIHHMPIGGLEHVLHQRRIIILVVGEQRAQQLLRLIGQQYVAHVKDHVVDGVPGHGGAAVIEHQTHRSYLAFHPSISQRR